MKYEDVGLYDAFSVQVKRYPEKRALEEGSTWLSYQELHTLATLLADRMSKMGVGRESAVAILMQPCLLHVVAQLSVSLLEATCVSMDPDLPDVRLSVMRDECDLKVAVLHEATRTRCFDGVPALFVDEVLHSIIRDVQVLHDRLACYELLSQQTQNFLQCNEMSPTNKIYSVTYKNADNNNYLKGNLRAYIMYTSGTMGSPKGVEITAKGITRIAFMNEVNITHNDVMVQITNFGFDASLFEIWGALLNGCTLILIPKCVTLNPNMFREIIIQKKVSIIFLTTALFNIFAHFYPSMFATVRCLIFGGERANIEVINKVYSNGKPKHLIHAYGPTEGSIFTSLADLQPEDLTINVTIGRPITNTQVHILDSSGIPVLEGTIGEIYITGDGLARGYCNHEDSRFLQLQLGGTTIPAYRTGDLGRWNCSKLYFEGRIDNQIKIRGYRVEPEEIEKQLLQSGLIREAAVLVMNGDNEPYLIAFVSVMNKSFTSTTIKNYLIKRLPLYMIPNEIIVYDHLPLNCNNKIDRTKLLKLYSNKVTVSNCSNIKVSNSHYRTIANIWKSVLNINDDIRICDNFFDLGGNSLSCVRACLLLQDELQILINNRVIYEHPTIKSLYEWFMNEGFSSQSVSSDDKWLHDIKLADSITVNEEQIIGSSGCENQSAGLENDWIHDAKISDNITITDDNRIRSKEPPRIFLTGATGFLGVHVLRELLEHTCATVLCLVRNNVHDKSVGDTDKRLLKRLFDKMHSYSLWNETYVKRVNVLRGDLSEKYFGLSEQTFVSLADSVHAIFHVGARINYAEPYSMHRATNVLGTLQILRLAAVGRGRPLHYVSTIAVTGPCGLLLGYTNIMEEEPLDKFIPAVRYDMGYVQSKWTAEQLVKNAQSRGVRVSVYRPGFILGTALCNNDDFVACLVRGCVRIGCWPNLPSQSKQFVTVDFVAKAIVRFSLMSQHEGKVFHLVPMDDRILSLNDFMKTVSELVEELTTRTLSSIDYRHWLYAVRSDPALNSSPLLPLLDLLSEEAHPSGLTLFQLYAHMPRYDTTNTVRACHATGVYCPGITRRQLRLYLKNWLHLDE